MYGRKKYDMINMSITKPQFNILSDHKSFFPLNFATNEQSYYAHPSTS